MIESSRCRRFPAISSLAVLLGSVACAPSADPPDIESEVQTSTPQPQDLSAPAGPASLAPNLQVADGELVLSWLEEVGGPSGKPRHRLLVSRLASDGWSAPSVIAEGSDFFANWADIPAVVAARDGTFYAHWLAMTGDDTYAYSIFLAFSEDRGRSWAPLGRLNDDDTPTEHGFVSFVSESAGVRAFWLDGRQMVGGGAMNLRTAMVGDRIPGSEVLDTRVCECCATDAMMTDQGPVAIFRDRSEDEIRDIGIVRRLGDAWTATGLVATDGWKIEGCPVNGPAVAAEGQRLVVVWYTAAGEGPKVQMAVSNDAGASFGLPQKIDNGRPLGRVDVVDDGVGGFLISWLEGVENRAEIRLRRIDDDGSVGESGAVVRTSPSRASGFPRLARIGDALYLAMVDLDGENASRVRVFEIPISKIN